ncbi:hypothetical protein PZA11_002134 [Diplocarpon coronariae]
MLVSAGARLSYPAKSLERMCLAAASRSPYSQPLLAAAWGCWGAAALVRVCSVDIYGGRYLVTAGPRHPSPDVVLAGSVPPGTRCSAIQSPASQPAAGLLLASLYSLVLFPPSRLLFSSPTAAWMRLPPLVIPGLSMLTPTLKRKLLCPAIPENDR